MEGRGRWTRFLLVIPATIVAILLVRNVLSESAAVERLARARACEGRRQRCEPRMSRLIKTPLYHEIRFILGGDPLDVRCTRELYLVGDYGCRVVAAR
jgi:hypothetical protein